MGEQQDTRASAFGPTGQELAVLRDSDLTLKAVLGSQAVSWLTHGPLNPTQSRVSSIYLL